MTLYSAVSTTGIYCRPGCGAKPRAENVTTFEMAAAAEAAGYRACLRCRPYRVAGPIGAESPELVCRAVQLILGGALDSDGETQLGQRLGVSARHLRRLFNNHLGVTPTQFALSRRAHFARRLLDDSDLSITQIAFAAGFGSIRHFNRAMLDVFRASPRDLRDRRRRHDRLITDGGLALRVPVAAPFAWTTMLRYFAARAIPAVECVDDHSYRRTIVLDGEPGVLELTAGGPDHLILRAHLPYWEGVIHVVERAGRMLGIDVDITTGTAALLRDATLGPLVQQQPGLRVPGAWGPFEIGVHTVVNQVLDLAATRRILGNIVRAHGTPIPGLDHGLTHAFPSAETIALADLSALRLTRSIRDTVRNFASAIVNNDISLDGAMSFGDLTAALKTIPGLTSNAAQMIALRLGHLDAFPYDDGVSLALGGIAPRTPEPDTLADQWRPWRALAAMHLATRAEMEAHG